MSAHPCLLALAILALSAPAWAGKTMDVCRDANGNPYFTDRGCPAETANQGWVHVQGAQSYSATESVGARAAKTDRAGRAPAQNGNRRAGR